MKRSLLALAVLGAFAGAASAQSSVTLFGTIDLSARYVKNDGSAKRLSLSQDGINSSQLGFRGVEDLGGGLKASFTLLSGINADTGTTNTKFFNRRSTVSLSGGFGEVRLGRDYVPTFWNDTNFDAFGTNGVGDSSHIVQLNTATFVRADNSIGYFLPSNLGGIYGQLMAAAAEGGPSTTSTTTVSGGKVGVATTATGTATNPGRYIGGRIGFAAGPFDIAFAADQQRFVGGVGVGFNGNTASQQTYNLGGTYDFGVLKLLGYVDYDKIASYKEKRGSLSVIVPMGQGEIHAGYDYSKLTGPLTNKESQYKAGYVYNLSKRTAVYGTVSRLSNGGGAVDANGLSISGDSRLSVGGGTSITAAPTVGGKSTGGEVGVRHFF